MRECPACTPEGNCVGDYTCQGSNVEGCAAPHPSDPLILCERPRGHVGDHAALSWPAAPRITHGRHCSCSACAREDWTQPHLAPCGMHGPGCPAEYAPIRAASAGSGESETT